MFSNNPLQLGNLWRLWFLNSLFMVDPGELGNTASRGESGNAVVYVVVTLVTLLLLVLLLFGACIYILSGAN